jgi:lipoate-protein ligase A
MTGEANMRHDIQTLASLERYEVPPTLRFFRFSEPTVSYGRLQKRAAIEPLVPKSWSLVQRPTGGGIVYHEIDLCLSLAWRHGQDPLPRKAQDQYRWIHAVILEALRPFMPLRMAACCDVNPPESPFDTRECFKEPVGFDLLRENRKMVGGALSRRKNVTLYQGSIQFPLSLSQENALRNGFEKELQVEA